MKVKLNWLQSLVIVCLIVGGSCVKAMIMVKPSDPLATWFKGGGGAFVLVLALIAYVFWSVIRHLPKYSKADNPTVKPAPEIGSVTIDYRVTIKDYRGCLRVLSLHRWPPQKGKRGRGLGAWALMLGMMATLSWLLGWKTLQNDLQNMLQTIRSHPLLFAFVLTFLFTFLAGWLIVKLFLRRSIANTRGWITFNNGGVDERLNEISVHRDWAGFNGWRESDDLIVLMLNSPTGNRRGLYYPKRLFQSADDLANLRQLLEARLGGERAASEQPRS
jgi:hypothetical protein